MAQESCDLNKDEAEILKPSSSSSASPPPSSQIPEPQPQQLPPPTSPPPQPPAAAAAAQFLPNLCGDVPMEASKKRKLADAIATDAEALLVAVPAQPSAPTVLLVNRCHVCRKRVGLTGLRCRCGELFCPRHRHSETHNCSFDYKTAGREEIARANPVIRAEKIIKI